jgi:hypothetical protein
MAERSIEVETLLSAIRSIGSSIRSRRFRRFLLITLLLFGGCYLVEGPPFYCSDPIRIRVVAEDTGKPVDGAVGFASWYGRNQLGDGGKYLHVAEGMSGPDGWLTIPGWWAMRPWFYLMTAKDPDIAVYKPGSYWGSAENDGAHRYQFGRDDSWRVKRIAFWNGKTVPVTTFADAETERRIVDSTVDRLYDTRDHGPSELPHLWRAIDAGKDLIFKRSSPPSQRR